MANDDWSGARGGCLPVEYPYGNYRKNYYKLTTSNAAAVYLGQLMSLDSNGQAVPLLVNTAATIFTIGPVVGFADSNMNALPSSMLQVTAGPYLPANTDGYVLCADDPDQNYVVQVGTGANSLCITSAQMLQTSTVMYRSVSGNNITGFSTMELDPQQLTQTGSGVLQVLGLIPVKNSDGTTNAVGGNSSSGVFYTKLRVRAISHLLSQSPAQIGLGA